MSSLTNGAFGTDEGAVGSLEGDSVLRPVLVPVFSPLRGPPIAKEHTNATNRKSFMLWDSDVQIEEVQFVRHVWYYHSKVAVRESLVTRLFGN